MFPFGSCRQALFWLILTIKTSCHLVPVKPSPAVRVYSKPSSVVVSLTSDEAHSAANPFKVVEVTVVGGSVLIKPFTEEIYSNVFTLFKAAFLLERHCLIRCCWREAACVAVT